MKIFCSDTTNLTNVINNTAQSSGAKFKQFVGTAVVTLQKLTFFRSCFERDMMRRAESTKSTDPGDRPISLATTSDSRDSLPISSMVQYKYSLTSLTLKADMDARFIGNTSWADLSTKELETAFDKTQGDKGGAQFQELAATLEAKKREIANAAFGEPAGKARTAAAQNLIETVDTLIGKPRQTLNVINFAEHCLRSPELTEFGINADVVRDLAKWLNLADHEIPVGTGHCNVRMTSQELAQYVEPRFARAAEIYTNKRLGDPWMADALRQVRYVKGPRTHGAQLLDLMERAVALGAKAKAGVKFFQKDDGAPDVDKIFETIRKNLANEQKDGKNQTNPDLVDAVHKIAKSGALESVLSAAPPRPEDTAFWD